MNCSNKLTKINIECNNNIQIPKQQLQFLGDKCYINGSLVGDIIEEKGNCIKVKHNNGSFADGTIHTYYV